MCHFWQFRFVLSTITRYAARLCSVKYNAPFIHLESLLASFLEIITIPRGMSLFSKGAHGDSNKYEFACLYFVKMLFQCIVQPPDFETNVEIPRGKANILLVPPSYQWALLLSQFAFSRRSFCLMPERWKPSRNEHIFDSSLQNRSAFVFTSRRKPYFRICLTGAYFLSKFVDLPTFFTPFEI